MLMNIAIKHNTMSKLKYHLHDICLKNGGERFSSVTMHSNGSNRTLTLMLPLTLDARCVLPLKLDFKGNTMALQTVTVHVDVLTKGGSKTWIPGIHRGSDV